MNLLFITWILFCFFSSFCVCVCAWVGGYVIDKLNQSTTSQSIRTDFVCVCVSVFSQLITKTLQQNGRQLCSSVCLKNHLWQTWKRFSSFFGIYFHLSFRRLLLLPLSSQHHRHTYTHTHAHTPATTTSRNMLTVFLECTHRPPTAFSVTTDDLVSCDSACPIRCCCFKVSTSPTKRREEDDQGEEEKEAFCQLMKESKIGIKSQVDCIFLFKWAVAFWTGSLIKKKKNSNLRVIKRNDFRYTPKVNQHTHTHQSWMINGHEKGAH